MRVSRGSPWAQFADLWRGGLARETPTTLLLPLLTLWGVGVTTSVSILIAVTPESSVQTMLGILGYSLLGLIAFSVLVANTLIKKVNFLDIANFGYTKVLWPFAVGLVEVLAPFLVVIFVTSSFQQETGALSQEIVNGAYNVAFLAPSETLFFFWAMPTSWRPGAVLAPFIFATDHPVIWKSILAAAQGQPVLPFAQVLLVWLGLVAIGFVFLSIVFMGLVRWSHRDLFGVPNAIGSHAAYNAIAMTFVVVLGVLGIQVQLGVI